MLSRAGTVKAPFRLHKSGRKGPRPSAGVKTVKRALIIHTHY
jgi:hypothetical protein